jgi:hypothetical protein
MSDRSDPAVERGTDAGAPEQPKQVEKVKSDDEKLPEKFKVEGEKFVKEIEKVKSDDEKLPEKFKFEHEKFVKEIEKVKSDDEKLPEKFKIEGEKPPLTEHKAVKPEIKEHKIEKLEFEKRAEILQSPPPGAAPAGALDRETLLRHADALESMGRELRHFIEQSERPDLSRGALHDEPDQQDEPGTGKE